MQDESYGTVGLVSYCLHIIFWKNKRRRLFGDGAVVAKEGGFPPFPAAPLSKARAGRHAWPGTPVETMR